MEANMGGTAAAMSAGSEVVGAGGVARATGGKSSMKAKLGAMDSVAEPHAGDARTEGVAAMVGGAEATSAHTGTRGAKAGEGSAVEGVSSAARGGRNDGRNGRGGGSSGDGGDGRGGAEEAGAQSQVFDPGGMGAVQR